MTVTISGAKYHVTTEADLLRLLFALDGRLVNYRRAVSNAAVTAAARANTSHLSRSFLCVSEPDIGHEFSSQCMEVFDGTISTTSERSIVNRWPQPSQPNQSLVPEYRRIRSTAAVQAPRHAGHEGKSRPCNRSDMHADEPRRVPSLYFVTDVLGLLATLDALVRGKAA
jgi:hypothetical protein